MQKTFINIITYLQSLFAKKQNYYINNYFIFKSICGFLTYIINYIIYIYIFNSI